MQNARLAWGGEFPPHIEWRWRNRWQLVLGICVLRALHEADLVHFWDNENEDGPFLVIEPQVDDIISAAQQNANWRLAARAYIVAIRNQ